MTVSSTDADVTTESSTVIADTASVENTEAKSQVVDSYEAAVEAALKPESEATTASDEQETKVPAQEIPGEEAKDETELSEEELAKFTKSQQHRIRELAEKTKNARVEVETFKSEVEALKPKAERLDQLVGYMQKHEITPDHLDNALGLTAMINNGDYRNALPILEGLINQVRTLAGDVLPADLQQRVDLGYLTEADAKELNRAKVGERQTQERVQKERETAETQRAQREIETITTRAVTTAEAWNQEQVRTDPDWNLKRDLVTQGMENELYKLGAKGYPRSEKDTRDILDKVKAQVEKNLQRFRPAPKAMTTVTGGSVSPRSAAKPGSYLDAIDAGLANSRG